MQDKVLEIVDVGEGESSRDGLSRSNESYVRGYNRLLP